jgi:hypothetical protein
VSTLANEVVRERARAAQAKTTISSLIEQITEYQAAMEVSVCEPPKERGCVRLI